MKNFTVESFKAYRSDRHLLATQVSSQEITPDEAVFIVAALSYGQKDFLKAAGFMAKWKRALDDLPFNSVAGKPLSDKAKAALGHDENALVSKALQIKKSLRRRNPDLWDLVKDSRIFQIADKKKSDLARVAEMIAEPVDDGVLEIAIGELPSRDWTL